jgi:dTDP-glucose 4,6-dehydratase
VRILVTGGMGFIGSNYVRYHLKAHPNDEIVVIDKLTYAGNRANLHGVLDKFEFILGDICDPAFVIKAANDCDQILHFAAESHVDRSIADAKAFLRTNIEGTGLLLDAARDFEVDRFVQISTDEVYGSIQYGAFKETDPLCPSSPYSASKASADLLALAYHTTYDVPILITRSTNNYGPYQHVEKLIPLMITHALADKPLPVYGNGLNVRDWTYVEDNCAAIDIIRLKGTAGGIYNIGSHQEWTNIDIVKGILRILDKSESLITYVQDRPGHDFRYSVNTDKIKALGWIPRVDIQKGIALTVDWYRDNEHWWNKQQ